MARKTTRTPSKPIDAWHYPREQDAANILEIFRSEIARAVYFLAERRMGKTQFLLLDLAPAATRKGTTVVYASMWGDKDAPHLELLSSLRAAAAAAKKNRTSAALSNALKTIRAKAAFHGAEISAEVEFADNPRKAQSAELQEIAKLIDELASEKKGGLLLMIDEAQHLGASEAFESFAASLRTRIDANRNVKAVFTGSSRSGMTALFEHDKPLHNFASSYPFDELDDGFVAHMVDRLQFFRNPKISKKQQQELVELFRRIGRNPFLFRGIIEAMILLPSIDVSSAHRRVMDGVAIAGGYEERWKALPLLDKLVLQAMLDRKKLYGQEVMGAFQETMEKSGYKKTVTKGAIQSSARRLVDAQIVSPKRDGRGLYDVQLMGFKEWLNGFSGDK